MENKLAAINVTKGLATAFFTKNQSEAFEAQDHKLGKAFAFDGQRFIVVTPAQAKAYEEVIDKQSFEKHLDTYYSQLMGCLMVEFADIVIGIEEDGYAHS